MSKKLVAEDSKVVLEFLGKLNTDNPFPEYESYLSRSPHSQHDTMFADMHHDWLGAIFSKTIEQSNTSVANYPIYKPVAAELERLFVIGYALSAVYSELNEVDGKVTHLFKSGHPRWSNGPFLSGWITFRDKWDDDVRVPIGWVIRDAMELKTDSLVAQAHRAYEKTREESYSKVFRYNDDGTPVVIPEKAARFRVELAKLHETLKSIVEQLIGRIKEHC